jgi:hypothetical protein
LVEKAMWFVNSCSAKSWCMVLDHQCDVYAFGVLCWGR